jgi:hypothetical protein
LVALGLLILTVFDDEVFGFFLKLRDEERGKFPDALHGLLWMMFTEPPLGSFNGKTHHRNVNNKPNTKFPHRQQLTTHNKNKFKSQKLTTASAATQTPSQQPTTAPQPFNQAVLVLVQLYLQQTADSCGSSGAISPTSNCNRGLIRRQQTNK